LAEVIESIEYDHVTVEVPYRLGRSVWRWTVCWCDLSRRGCVWRIRGWTRTVAVRPTSTSKQAQTPVKARTHYPCSRTVWVSFLDNRERGPWTRASYPWTRAI